jgi:hypothetical protein
MQWLVREGQKIWMGKELTADGNSGYEPLEETVMSIEVEVRV